MLEPSPDEFRELAARVTEESARYLESLDERRTFPRTTGAETTAAFDADLPELGLGAAAFDELQVVADHSRAGTGRLFPYVASTTDPVAVLGDLYASVLDQNVTSWRSAPAATAIERAVVRGIADGIGCHGFVGSLAGGGSYANLMGLAMAREALLPANVSGVVHRSIVYTTTETHMSIPKAVALLGLGTENIRLVDMDDQCRMRPDALDQAIREDRAAGHAPLAVVATAGTVNTGAIDPLREIAELASEHGIWMHVDGAYGALAALAVPEKLDGLSFADSLSVDPHKWLYQPIDCGLLLYRDPNVARTAFSNSGDYVRSMSDDQVEGFAFFDQSLELTRRFRALKLWLSLRYHGLAWFRDAIRRDLEHAQLLARLVDAQPELELLAPVELSVVCFRWNDGSDPATVDRRNVELLRHMTGHGRVLISNATVAGAFALRACFVNHLATEADVHEVVDEVLRAERATRDG